MKITLETLNPNRTMDLQHARRLADPFGTLQRVIHAVCLDQHPRRVENTASAYQLLKVKLKEVGR